MGIKFTIQAVGGTLKTYGDLDNSTARQAIDIVPHSPEAVLKRQHIPGVDGNFIQRFGAGGRRIICRMRYYGTQKVIYENVKADQDAFYNTLCTIINDPSGANQSYASCQLDTGMYAIAQMKAAGDGTNAFLDVEAIFSQEAPV